MKISLTIAVLLVGALLIYAWIDRSITADHARRQLSVEQRRSKLLGEILLNVTREWEREKVRRLLGSFNKNHLVKENAENMEIDGIVLSFVNNKLDKILFLGDTQ